jgi:hypothetical protein
LGEKMKKLLVAAIVVLMASPAFAAIQNVKVSGDITSTWLDRSDFTLGNTDLNSGAGIADGTRGLKSQNVFLTQTRLRVDADLSDNVSTTVGLINERAWGSNEDYGRSDNNNQNTNVDLYLANVTLRELLYSPLTVTVGRQVFEYGNGLIMGNGPNNQGNGGLRNIAQDLSMNTAEDGVKAVLDYKPLTIDMFYFKNSQTSDSIRGFYGQNGASSDVYGINANYQLSDPWNTVVEAYMFNRINGNALATGTDKGSTLYVPGLRASTNPIKGLNVQAEVAVQGGRNPVIAGTPSTQEAENREAMAAQVLASYALPVMEKYKPTVNASYTYVSGDKNGNENQNSNPAVKSAKIDSAWDPMFESQGQGTIYNTLYPLSNMHILAVGASVNPLEDVNVAATWSGLWAAAQYGAGNPLYIYQPNEGSNLYAIPYSTKKDAYGLGNEYDLNMTYNYTEDVTFGVSLGWYVPGSALASTNRSTASQAIVDLGVKF